MPWWSDPDVFDDNGDGWNLDSDSQSWEPHIEMPEAPNPEPEIESE